MDALEPLTAFLEVEAPVGSLADDAGLRRKAEHPAQAAAAALGPVQIAGPAPGVPWHGYQADCGGEVPGIVNNAMTPAATNPAPGNGLMPAATQ